MYERISLNIQKHTKINPSISSNGVVISKLKDEWYLLRIVNQEIHDFKCDQEEGLFKCIENIPNVLSF